MAETVGFIGSGAIAGALARLSLAVGLRVVMSNSRGPETLADLVEELGGQARAATLEEAAPRSARFQHFVTHNVKICEVGGAERHGDGHVGRVAADSHEHAPQARHVVAVSIVDGAGPADDWEGSNSINGACFHVRVALFVQSACALLQLWIRSFWGEALARYSE